MIKWGLLHITLCLLIISSCKKDNFETVNRAFGKSYVNTTVGSYNVYKVEEIVYNDFNNTVDTLRYTLKELNESVFKDNLGRNSIRLERYKLNEKSQWAYWNTWFSTTDNFTMERVEENKRLVKLSLPLSDDAVWNINAYNSDNSITAYYDFIHKPYKLDTFSFDSAIAVKSETINSFIRQRQYYEVYANKIGLVYKNIVYIDLDITGTQKRGYKIKQQLIQHVP